MNPSHQNINQNDVVDEHNNHSYRGIPYTNPVNASAIHHEGGFSRKIHTTRQKILTSSNRFNRNYVERILEHSQSTVFATALDEWKYLTSAVAGDLSILSTDTILHLLQTKVKKTIHYNGDHNFTHCCCGMAIKYINIIYNDVTQSILTVGNTHILSLLSESESLEAKKRIDELTYFETQLNAIKTYKPIKSIPRKILQNLYASHRISEPQYNILHTHNHSSPNYINTTACIIKHIKYSDIDLMLYQVLCIQKIDEKAILVH